MSDNEGEAWKGEPERRPLFGFGLWGPPATAEQIAEEKMRLARVMAEGNLKYEALGGFSLTRQCPKCKSEETAKVRYAYPASAPQTLGEHDALERTCRRCKYSWFEKTEDV